MLRDWRLSLVTCLEVRKKLAVCNNWLSSLSPGVVYAGIDTDKHRYPIGSGRVTFGNPHSYMKAVAAAFVEIKCQKFCKKVQVSLILNHKYNWKTLSSRWILIWKMRSAHHVSSDKGLTFAG